VCVRLRAASSEQHVSWVQIAQPAQNVVCGWAWCQAL
jgi:hypothetical protein